MEPKFYCFGVDYSLPWPSSAKEWMANGFPINRSGIEFDHGVRNDPDWIKRFAFRSRQNAINAGIASPATFFAVVVIGPAPNDCHVVYEN